MSAVVLAAALAIGPADHARAVCGVEESAAVDIEFGRAASVFRRLSSYRKLPQAERDAFRIAFRLVPRREGGRACVVVGDDAVPAATETRPDIAPPDAAALAANPVVAVVAPAGERAAIEAILEPPVAPAAVMSAEGLRRGAVQADRFVRRAHGVIGWIAPGVGGVRFEWDGPAPEADAVFADGRRVPLPVFYDAAEFMPLKDKSFAGADRLEFGTAPKRAVFAP